MNRTLRLAVQPPRLSPDGWLILAASGLRSFAYGFLSVMLGLYLTRLGLGNAAVGAIFTAALAGGALMTIVISSVADRAGRRHMLMLGALLMLVAGVVFALTSNPAVLMLAAVVGSISPSGKDVGPFLSLEQAILPETTPDEQRTSTFATYNLVASLSSALGALIAGVPSLLGIDDLTGDRILIGSYALIAGVLFVLFSRLSPSIEARGAATAGPVRHFGLHRSRSIVFKLAALFALDSFAGGFIVQALIALWFVQRFDVQTEALAGIFFGTNLLAAVSFLAAAPIARRIGLLNTMVFTHLPSNVLLLLVPAMPNLSLAVAMLLLRNLLSQLDVPTRQSYTMAVVAPDERSAAAGLTSVARNGAAAIAPVFAGATLALPALGLPFLIAGSLKIVYDIWILMAFRQIRPPEEVTPSLQVPATSDVTPDD